MRLFSIVLVMLSLSAAMAYAKPAELNAFKAAYPNASSALKTCKACHDGVPKLNYYGQDYVKAGKNFKAIEALDSDGDGFSNLAEITAGTFPGDKASHP